GFEVGGAALGALQPVEEVPGAVFGRRGAVGQLRRAVLGGPGAVGEPPGALFGVAQPAGQLAGAVLGVAQPVVQFTGAVLGVGGSVGQPAGALGGLLGPAVDLVEADEQGVQVLRDRGLADRLLDLAEAHGEQLGGDVVGGVVEVHLEHGRGGVVPGVGGGDQVGAEVGGDGDRGVVAAEI